MDDAMMEKFIKIMDRDCDWDRCYKMARRAGIMIFLHPSQDRDWVTGVKWDSELFVRHPIDGEMAFEGYCPIAWRRDFVEKVLVLDSVPNLAEMPPINTKYK